MVVLDGGEFYGPSEFDQFALHCGAHAKHLVITRTSSWHGKLAKASLRATSGDSGLVLIDDSSWHKELDRHGGWAIYKTGFKASLTLNMDYAFVSSNRAKFDKAFTKDVAKSRGLPEAAVTLSTVSAGSVVVDFTVKGAETCNPASMIISPTELMLLCPSCPPVNISAIKCTGVVRTVPEPEGPLQVFRVTHYLDTSCDVKTEYKSHVAVDMAAALSIRKQAIVVHNVTAQVSNKVAVVCTITGGFVDAKAIKDKLKGAEYPSLARVCSTAVVPATTVIVAEKDPTAKPNQCLAKNGGCHDQATCAWLAQDGNKDKTAKCTCSPGFKGDGTLLGSGCVSTCKPCPLSQQKTCSRNAQCCMKLGKGATLTEHTCACKVGFLGNGLICTEGGLNF
jgi:hypothetical protein